jgi:hypothetical protein
MVKEKTWQIIIILDLWNGLTIGMLGTNGHLRNLQSSTLYNISSGFAVSQKYKKENKQ